MFRKKTFNLVNEEEAKKRESLYEPKRCRWMKYIVIPAMIGFILLLILMNVDFSDRREIKVTSIGTSFSASTTETTLLPSELKSKSVKLQPKSYKKVTKAASCNDQGVDLCTIVCADGNVNFIADDLNNFERFCSEDMSLIINNCTFPSQKLTAYILRGAFYIRSLEILNSNLIEIDDGAFETYSMVRLKTLRLSTTALTMLTDKSFVGLIALKELNFTNVSFSKFKGLRFLQPVAKTLQQVSLSQQGALTVYDPFNWLNGTQKYSSLERVDLSGNNFANTLIRETFSNLLVVRELILRNCAITALPMDTFDDIVDTLEYLDLSLNSLQMLNVSNLLGHKNGLHLELHGNTWSCTCENLQLIRALKTDAFNYDKEPQCVSPPEWKDKPLKDVQLKCGDEEPAITLEPPVTPESTLTPKPNTSSTADPLETPSTNASSTLSTTEASTRPNGPSTPSMEPTPSLDPSTNITISPTDTTSTPKFDENENSKESTTTESTTLDTSKPTPPKPTSPSEPPKPIEMTCKRESTNITTSIRNFDARFNIQQTSASSVALFIFNNKQLLSLFYFCTINGTNINYTESHEIELKPNCHSQRPSTAFTVIHIDSLQSNGTYIFCLVPHEELTTSPFNCKAHVMTSKIFEDSTSWLLSDDQAWFYTVNIFAMALTVTVGMISVYWLLRWRPSWLRGCKRIIRADDSTSHQVYLLPKVERKTCEDSYYDNERNDFDNHSNLALDIDSKDYMQFYRNLQEANRNRKVDTLSSMMAPKEEAPAIPQDQSRTVSMQSTIPADDLREQFEMVAEENDYQSIDYYEHLF